MQRGPAILLYGLVRRGEQLLQIHAGAEVAAGAAQRDYPHGRVEIGALERGQQRVDHRRVDGVLLVRPVERGGEHPALHRDQDLLVAAHRDASISISRRSNAVENTLPWASVLSEIVPPPSRAPCSRKLSAPRLGSS